MVAAGADEIPGPWQVGDAPRGTVLMDALSVLADPIAAPDVLRASLAMECDALAPRKARGFTRRVLTDWGFGELEDRALLIVSELSTNAYKHGRTKAAEESETVRLTLASIAGDVLGIQMTDNCAAPPIPRVPALGSLTGRGLHLVAAESDAWTSRPHPDHSGKNIWALLRCPGQVPTENRVRLLTRHAVQRTAE